jgi:hypothetical protein
MAFLVGEAGCPKCAHPIEVQVIQLDCEYAPCEPNEVASVDLEYSLDGGPFTPCDGTSCGDDSGGCDSETEGTYRIIERSDEEAATTVVVDAYSCISGGAIATITVGRPKCPPVVAPSFAVAGAITWNVGAGSESVTLPSPQSENVVSSAASLVPTEAGGHDSIDAISANVGPVHLTFELGDIRALGVGQYELGESVTGALGVVCATSCSTSGTATGATLFVEQAVGGPLPWPATVSDDFVRRYRLVYQTTDLVGDALDTDCTGCTNLVSLSVDVTFERTALDYGLSQDGSCRVE